MIKIGDKIVCDNGHTYIIGTGNDHYEFSIIDEFGEEVNLVTEYYLRDCMPWHEEDQSQLSVGLNYNAKTKYTYIKEYIDYKNNKSNSEIKLKKFIKDNSGIWDLEDTYEFMMEYKIELLKLLKELQDICESNSNSM